MKEIRKFRKNDEFDENEIKTQKYGVLELVKPKNYDDYYSSDYLYVGKYEFPKILKRDDYYTILWALRDGSYEDIFYHNRYYVLVGKYDDESKIKYTPKPIEKYKEYYECDGDLFKTFCKLNKINPNKKIICTEKSNKNRALNINSLNIFVVKQNNKRFAVIGSMEYVDDNYKITICGNFDKLGVHYWYYDLKLLEKIPLVAYLKGYPKMEISKRDIDLALDKFIDEYNYNSKDLIGYDKFKEVAGSNNNEDEDKNEMDEIEEKQKEEKRINAERKELINNILTLINSLNETVHRLERLNNPNNNIMKDIYHSIKVDENLLFENVNGHFEVRSEFIPVLKFIDLSLTSPSNLKLSGIDWSETNLASYNPQLAYNKDLSFAKFNDSNLFGDFTNCDLRGTYLKDEKWLIGIEDAITDENTILPDSNIKSNTL